jgi:hypothetical protein
MSGDDTSAKAAKARAEIERAREQITASAHALRQEVAMRTDWREWVRRKPALLLFGAFAIGFVMGRRQRR